MRLSEELRLLESVPQELAGSHVAALRHLLEVEHAECEFRPSQADLGEVLGIDKSNVARLCQRMQEAGHIERVRCSADGRVRRLALTPAGRQLALEIEGPQRAHFVLVVAGISDSERRSILAALERLHGAVAAARALLAPP